MVSDCRPDFNHICRFWCRLYYLSSLSVSFQRWKMVARQSARTIYKTEVNKPLKITQYTPKSCDIQSHYQRCYSVMNSASPNFDTVN